MLQEELRVERRELRKKLREEEEKRKKQEEEEEEEVESGLMGGEDFVRYIYIYIAM